MSKKTSERYCFVTSTSGNDYMIPLNTLVRWEEIQERINNAPTAELQLDYFNAFEREFSHYKVDIDHISFEKPKLIEITTERIVTVHEKEIK